MFPIGTLEVYKSKALHYFHFNIHQTSPALYVLAPALSYRPCSQLSPPLSYGPLSAMPPAVSYRPPLGYGPAVSYRPAVKPLLFIQPFMWSFFQVGLQRTFATRMPRHPEPRYKHRTGTSTLGATTAWGTPQFMDACRVALQGML